MINIDNSYSILNDNLRGRKPKFKVEKNGKIYIYKYGSVNSEIWAELIAEQLGLQAGIGSLRTCRMSRHNRSTYTYIFKTIRINYV